MSEEITLAGQVDGLRRRMDAMDGVVRESFSESKFSELFAGLDAHMSRIESIETRLDKLQDANLAPLLESSALLVELRRIGDALETLAKSCYFDGAGDQYFYAGRGGK